MRLIHSICGLACLTLALVPAAGRADAPADPLRLVPDQADLLLKIEQPRQLIEAYTTLDLLKQLQAFNAFREFMDSTNYRRFYQFVAYFERELGAKWPELLDRMGGGGVVVAVKLGPNPAPALTVIQSKDEELLKKVVQVGLEMVGQELARQEAKDKIEKGSYREVDTVRIGKEFHAARIGAALLIGNSAEVLHAAIDRQRDSNAKSLAGSASIAECRKLLPPNPLAWAWLNMDTVRKAPQAREVFTQPRNDANLTVLFGGWLDVARRAPFLSAGLYRQSDGFAVTVRMPRGRQGMNEGLGVHVPPDAAAGSLPLLEPKGVLYSSSYYLDVGKFWDERTKLFNDKQVKALEDFDKNSGRFLAGSQFSKLATQAGAHQRVVVVHQDRHGYQVVPNQRIPAFAVVLELRDPEKFSKSMESILRGAALLAGAQFKLKLTEEKEGDVAIVGYRFPEDGKVPGDVNNIRFNFSPCFAAVGDQFIFCSTLELAHELIGLLQKEAKGPRKLDPAAVRSQFYSAGAADLLHAVEDQLLAQTILDQALPPKEAKEQVKAFVEFVRRLGVVQEEIVYGAEDFRVDFRVKLGR